MEKEKDIREIIEGKAHTRLMDEKKAFLEQFEKLLKMTRLNVDKLELSGCGEYVDLIFISGYRRRVCIACDSRIGIIRDVIKSL